MLAELCEGIGADWAEIAPALRLDRRIGPHAYLKPGLGIAGGNLERDLETVLRLARGSDADAGAVLAWLANSRRRRDWALRTLKARVLARNPKALIAILGLAYKEDTHSTKNSPALALIAGLAGHRIKVHDPVVPATAAPGCIGAGSALEAAQGADALVLMTPWPEFRKLEAKDLARVMAGRNVIDPYGLLEPESLEREGFDYATLGRRPAKAGAHA
jgi:UDPglucose 6-dehydrogenase